MKIHQVKTLVSFFFVMCGEKSEVTEKRGKCAVFLVFCFEIMGHTHLYMLFDFDLKR